MLWAATLGLAFSFIAIVHARDASSVWNALVDTNFPQALDAYSAVINKFPVSNPTPDDIDGLYRAGDDYYKWYMSKLGVAEGLSLMEISVSGNYATKPQALATFFNSTSKLTVLLHQFEVVMTATSHFEKGILAQGTPGHWAVYQNLDFLAYSTYVLNGYYIPNITSGQSKEIEEVFRKLYQATESVRAQFYRDGYGQQPRDL